jgi:hypothetical protein
MPIHDWTRVDAGSFHDFHQAWTIALRNTLNRGGLPRGYFAMADQTIGGPIPFQQKDVYAKRANRIVIKHSQGRVVSIIEIVSPGNKGSQHAVRAFIEKACDLIDGGIHVLIVDLFPPTKGDPQGIHGAICDEFGDESFRLPADKPLAAVSYLAGLERAAYVEPVAVGDSLPELPLFLTPDQYVPTPLENTYEETWDVCPDPVRDVLEAERL